MSYVVISIGALVLACGVLTAVFLDVRRLEREVDRAQRGKVVALRLLTQEPASGDLKVSISKSSATFHDRERTFREVAQ
jgi:hypothetical protein